MGILAPLYASRDNANPQNSRNLEFSGVLQVNFDPYYIAGMVTKDVRSGKTGYPWIIDKDGIFLAHFEKSFVGQNQSQVREERNRKYLFPELTRLCMNIS